MWRRILAIVLILAGIVVLVELRSVNIPTTYSPNVLLQETWTNYKKQFITSDGRVVDPSQDSVTTSEGQSYALLRAVFTDDRPTFDTVWKWTNTNLKRSSDNLFGWRWGKLSNGTTGFLPGGGSNSAADADNDIALALILAGDRWHDVRYMNAAQKIIANIWSNETMVVNGRRYLVAGNWVRNSKYIYVNPSYFNPPAWRVFAQVDRSHNWMSLVDSSYYLLLNVGFAPLNTKTGSGLPPDWVILNPTTGNFEPPKQAGYTTDYSFDATRVPFRVALDYAWFQEPRALAYLQGNFNALKQDFQNRDKLAITYSHNGKPATDAEGPTMYATSLGYFMNTDPNLAKRIYNEKIMGLYLNADNTFKDGVKYYEQNWLWFGMALYSNYLTNYTK